MTFHAIASPVVSMKEEPKDLSKVVSQAFFSEAITVVEELRDWALIQTSDKYLGWVPKKAFCKSAAAFHPNCFTTRLSCHIYPKTEIEYGPYLTLPFGIELMGKQGNDPRWIELFLPTGATAYIQTGDISFEKKVHTKNTLAKWSLSFLGLPYTWGGRSSFGFDCSGFVQMLYRQLGLYLQRDARLQILDERLQVVEKEELETGDLLFFGKGTQKISHVGLFLGKDQFIHATVKEDQPWIRISSLKEWTSNTAPYAYATFRQFKEVS